DGPGAGAAGEQRADRGRGGPGSRIYRSVLLLPAVPRRLRGEPLAVPRRLPRRAGATSALTGGLRRASPRSAQLGERLGDLLQRSLQHVLAAGDGDLVVGREPGTDP